MRSVNPPDDASGRLVRWVAEHGVAVRGFLLGLVRKSDLADDLLQETFRRAWDARGRYREEGKARAYLLRIADRLVVDYVRRASGREVSQNEEAWQVSEPASREVDPSERLRTEEDHRELNAALASLNALQRRVLLLRYFGELEFSEIANQLDCPLGTVLSHCRRGLEKLRKIMGDDAP